MLNCSNVQILISSANKDYRKEKTIVLHVDDPEEQGYSVVICPYNASDSSLGKSCCNTTNHSNCSESDGVCTIREQIECFINGNNLQRSV